MNSTWTAAQVAGNIQGVEMISFCVTGNQEAINAMLNVASGSVTFKTIINLPLGVRINSQLEMILGELIRL